MSNLILFNNFKDWKLRERIFIGYSIPLLMSIGIVGLVYSNIWQVDQQNKRENIGEQMVKYSDSIALSIARVQRSTRGYLIAPQEENLNSFNEAELMFEQATKDLKVLVEVPEQKQRLARITELGNRSIQFNSSLIKLVRDGKLNEAIGKYKSDDRVNLYRELEQILDEFKAKEDSIQAEKTQETEAALVFLKLGVIVSTLVSAILAIPIGLWIAARITETINESVNAIASSSTEIASTIEEQEHTATQQASAVHQTTSTMDELGASSRQSSQQAEMSVIGAQKALQKAEEGTDAVEQTLAQMAELKQKVEAIAQQILHLSQQTNQIGNISIVVSELANQTNMLALNAAVEAVRAGENGKGFGVVASEIRKLADASKKSAEKINVLVGDIQKAIDLTVMVTTAGTKTAEEGELIVQKTASAFTGVTEAINNVFISSQQISLNAKQQAVAIQQVVEAMNSLNTAAIQSANGITQTKIGTQKLSEAALNLKAVI